jgi:ABC-type uncharacterized transport system substrate-binding protein
MPLCCSPWRAVVFLVVLSLLNTAPAAAHPHVFIDYTVTVIFDDSDVRGLRMSWTFDDMYSSMLFHDFTSRPKGPLAAADINRLKRSAFEDSVKYHYFTDINLNGKTVEVKAVADFTASFENHRMTYTFTVPVKTEGPGRQNTLEVASFDHEFFIDYELAKKAPVIVENGEKLGASCAPKKARKKTSIFGPIDTMVVACTYSKTG